MAKIKITEWQAIKQFCEEFHIDETKDFNDWDNLNDWLAENNGCIVDDESEPQEQHITRNGD